MKNGLAGKRIKVTYRPLAELKPDSKNPRAHSPRQVKQIARSMEAFGFNVPILIDADGKIIAGHGRFLACRQLGWKEAPTICLDHLTEAQARAFMIADNRLTETSTWDESLLVLHLKELAALDLDFSLEATGFELGEIDLRIEESSSKNAAEQERADSLPESIKEQVSRRGDLWLLNNHRVLCGSALDEQDFRTLMRAERAASVFGDPPYNLKVDNIGNLGSTRHREFMMASGEMSPEEFKSFLARAFALLARYSVGGALHFICMDWRHLEELMTAGREAYRELKNLVVWVKDRAGMGSLYRSQHELIFVFKSGRGSHRNNIQLGRFGRYRTNVWHYPSASTLSRSADEGNLLTLHPTVKPAALVSDAIMDCTDRHDVVLDPFLGSGTTVIAAERTGRRCFGLELDPGYVDIVVQRWQEFTRGRAIHAESGRTFDELRAQRRVEEASG